MDANIQPMLEFLKQSSAEKRVKAQQTARELLFEQKEGEDETLKKSSTYKKLRTLLSSATRIFTLTAVQKDIYHSDSGTAAIPDFIKKQLLNMQSGFIVRPGSLDDLQKFVAFASQNKLHYTIRAAASWPFGGVLPMSKEIILDLMYLDFYQLDSQKVRLVVAPGVIFADMRKYLRDQGFALHQEITNTNSGTICGWVVTGGLGIGTYKYGHIRNSVEAILLLKPDGEWQTLTPDDEMFAQVFNSEGQIGIVAGVVLKVKRLTYVSKPYAFSLENLEDVIKFVNLISEWKLQPTSIIYFNNDYLHKTYEIQKEKLQKKREKAIESGDDLLLKRTRHDLETTELLKNLQHVLVMEFDTQEDYEKTLKNVPFSSRIGKGRIRDITFWHLPVSLTHKLWEHRYMPVEMKSKGPSMLVSETILPLEQLPNFVDFVQAAITSWTHKPVKIEGHLLQNNEILVQSIILADTESTRHKIYLSLIPFMMQASIYFGGRPYGTGIWNLPFLNILKKNDSFLNIDNLAATKRKLDPHGLVNQCKYINPAGRKFVLRLYNKITPPLLGIGVRFLHGGKLSSSKFSIYSLGKLFWNVNKIIFPAIVPPQLQAQRHPILQINAACAECDSCEKVCPTSDVFGLLETATPITRRKTANRVAKNEKICREEALGFLVCTRCDNCTRVCPADIPLTEMFDLVEKENNFQMALGFNGDEKKEFIDRFWEVMKESPLYQEHTLSEQKGDRSHLEHGLKIIYPRGFPYAELFIDEETCIHCGMCGHEHACTYGAREGHAREIPKLLDVNCALCNACINYCPQNKEVQTERGYIQKLSENAVDLDEKKYWENQKYFLRDTTTIQRSTELTDMADIYVTEDILMEIDKESSKGQIPVSGMGQGDRHMGIGFDAERFSHFHIVGPAQNRLHEGDPEEELSIILGKRYRYCKFDKEGNLHNPPYPNIKLMSPILYNTVPLNSNGRVELSFIKVAEKQKTLVSMNFYRLLEYYDFFIEEGGYEQLPPVLALRVDFEMVNHLRINPHIRRKLLMDLWKMPMFEISFHEKMERTIQFIKDSTTSLYGRQPLLCGYIEVAEYDVINGQVLVPALQEKIQKFLENGVDALHIHGLRNTDQYFVTSSAIRGIHHYLMQIGRRHEVSLLASGGIRLASDSQKTIQRGAEATLIDFAALLSLDPYAYKAMSENKATTEKLINIDINWAVQRLENQMESRKVQILEVLGASGFKDIKKTVGEEGRLIDFYQMERRIQKSIFENQEKVNTYRQLNKELINAEPLSSDASPRYKDLKKQLVPLKSPHDFYELGEVNQHVYQRDHVWPGELIQALGRMAAGDPQMVYLRNVKGTGLLGDGFDVMKILYHRDPDVISEEELNRIQTALPLDKGLVLRAPWMFGGKSVGSIGLDTWLAHVKAARELGIQFDTGEGGYPTCFFLNSKGEPIFFTETDIQKMKPYFKHGRHYTILEIENTLHENKITEETHPGIFEQLGQYPKLQPFLFYITVDEKDEPFVSTEIKTGIFGVTKETIKKARRIVIAYSQGAKMGIGGHILAQKVNKLVSYLRGIQGLEELDHEKIRLLIARIEKLEKNTEHPLRATAQAAYTHFIRAHDEKQIFPEFKQWLWQLQQKAYELNADGQIDPIEFEQIIRLCEEVINQVYTSVISPFPFHNCYSIEDVKAFIDVVRMINPDAVISVKVSPSIDIEFIATGLGRIAKDNTERVLKNKIAEVQENTIKLSETVAEYVRQYGMKIEIWLDGPRGGTGASPNIIKGQMGMHIEYAIPLIHDRLVQDGLRNYVKFIVSGGIRTYEDVIKAVALGADGVIWGTAPMVTVGCDRNRNCHDGCSRGIATSNLIMQNLRDVELNAKQMLNAFRIIQMQIIRALAGLGLRDIRELRGRYDKIQWIGLKERVDFRLLQRQGQVTQQAQTHSEELHPTAQSNCGVAAIIGTEPIPSYILDKTLSAMKNRGMDGVGIGKTLCFPRFPHHYAYRIMVKGKLQLEIEEELRQQGDLFDDEKALQQRARMTLIKFRAELTEKIRMVFLEPYFDFAGETDVQKIREPYKKGDRDEERDYREFGNENTDPGDIFCFFVRVKSEVLQEFIEKEILSSSRYKYIREYFPDTDLDNYSADEKFMQKAEDLFVFDHSIILTQTLYVQDVVIKELTIYAQHTDKYKELLYSIKNENPFSSKNMNGYLESYLSLLRDFARKYPFTSYKEKYSPRLHKVAAVMSCGKNFAIWKTAGREIPWETPESPNNIIHVRLATGSIVEQMNAHPFGKLHTALTHNGETTNYVALKQRVEQFGLPPLATTDTEVASLKFHLLAEELEYPDWALFESFSPTTGDDLALIPKELRAQLEEVQRVEFASSPDGPYQYLCLRHQPENNITERIDLKDPADLRPSTTAIWIDHHSKTKRAFSMIASEEQAIAQMMDLLDKEGLIDGAAADKVIVSDGMINRFHYDDMGKITNFELFDRYGRMLEFADPGKHYSIHRSTTETPEHADNLLSQIQENRTQLKTWIRQQLAEWDFNTYRRVLEYCLKEHDKIDYTEHQIIDLLTYFADYLHTMNTGDKAKSSLKDMTRTVLNRFFDQLDTSENTHWVRLTSEQPNPPQAQDGIQQTLLIDARNFEADGTEPTRSLSALLAKAYDSGWRRYILYRVNGQRLISPAVMGRGDTDEVEIDVFGVPGEYFGAFMQGGTLRCHGNSQNFTAMCMHHGNINIYGNAGKVCGYASKGGKVFIFGDIVDRAWTNSVNDPRCQDLEVNVLGSASKYAGESLMGGQFFFGGLFFDDRGKLCTQARPYRGTKLMGGASRGNMLFFDPYDRLEPQQYVQGKLQEITAGEWPYWQNKVEETLRLAGVEIITQDGTPSFEADSKQFQISPQNFKLIVPKGGLKGYESH